MDVDELLRVMDHDGAIRAFAVSLLLQFLAASFEGSAPERQAAGSRTMP